MFIVTCFYQISLPCLCRREEEIHPAILAVPDIRRMEKQLSHPRLQQTKLRNPTDNQNWGFRPMAPVPATSSHVTDPSWDCLFLPCHAPIPQPENYERNKIMVVWYPKCWRGLLGSSEQKKCPTLSLKMGFGLMNSLPLLPSRGVFFEVGKGAFLNVTFLEQQHVICIFSYNQKSENKNIVQNM